MATNRRSFLKSAALASAAMGILPTGFETSPEPGPERPRPARASSPKRVLVLGGTGFIGPPMVEHLLERGHTVTIFNRGRTNTDLFPEVEKLVGDRNDNLDSLKGRSWDVVFDNHATLPRWVRQTAELLKDSVGRYVHVSTISVYAQPAYTLPDGRNAEPGWNEEERLRLDEDAPLAQLPDDWDGSEQVTGLTYGPFKWMAEAEAEKAFPGRATIVRPGLIVGPGDPTDRFTYWPVRIDRGGEVLVPGHGGDSVQFIDARDLTRFIVELAENGVSGRFNATGPETRLSMEELVHGIRAVTTGPIRFTWVDAEFLDDQGVRPWADMPVWIPGDPVLYVRIDRAVEAGLTFRPLADTARDTIEWHASRPEEQRSRMRSGLTFERESELLAAWHGR